MNTVPTTKAPDGGFPEVIYRGVDEEFTRSMAEAAWALLPSWADVNESDYGGSSMIEDGYLTLSWCSNGSSAYLSRQDRFNPTTGDHITGTLRVRHMGHDGITDMDPTTARELARELLVAADVFDREEGAVSAARLTRPTFDQDGGRYQWVMDCFGSGEYPDWDLEIKEYPADEDGPASLDALIMDRGGEDGWDNLTADEIRTIANDYEAFPGVLRSFADRFEDIREDFLRRHPDGTVRSR